MRLNLPTSRVLGPWLAFVAMLTLAHPVRAGLIFISDPADLGANDAINWTTGNHADPFSTMSVGGVGVTVLLDYTNGTGPTPIATGPDSIQGPKSGGTFGIVPLALTLTFDEPIHGGGADLSPVFGFFGSGQENFISLEAFGLGGRSLGSTSIQITSSAQNHQPVFLGLLSDSANITELQFNMVGYNFILGDYKGAWNSTLGDIALLDNASPSTAVPEPASLTLFGLGLLALASYGWRREAARMAGSGR
jgi:hypothetical protein